MATILNYLKGNYLVSNLTFLTHLECPSNLNELSQKIIAFSLVQNQKTNDRQWKKKNCWLIKISRNVIILDFDLNSKEKYSITTKSQIGNLQIFSEKNSNTFLIPVRTCFNKSSRINDSVFVEEGLEVLVETLKTDFSKGKTI